MPLTPGARLGPYEILDALGAGGMGEVYRGLDPRLGREVAIKILPREFGTDPDRLHRFGQEARATATLNHPNILAVHDVGEHNGLPYIVSELLEGETLRTELTVPAQRRLPVRKALEYAVQMARGLAAAHDKGIVHRDLKPENVFVSADGHVKILDFGLAKLAQPNRAPEVTGGGETTPGVVMGTIGYMAPEQVRGQPADHRADVFAFGAMLYEMLSGRRAFEGQTSADTMTAILKEQPRPLPATDPQMAPGLARIVDRCLEKNPNARFQSAHDLGSALEGASTPSDAIPAKPSSRLPLPPWLPWALAAAATLAFIATAALAFSYYRRPREAIHPVRFQHTPPPGSFMTVSATSSSFAVSPDGRRLVFTAANAAGTPMLWLQPLDSVEARPIPGTEGARQPFWSADSRHIGFFGIGALRRVPVGGGPPQTVVDTTTVSTGGTWNLDDVIVFSSLTGPLRRVPAAGGEMAMASVLDGARRNDAHSFPHFLPDGNRFLYHVRSSGSEPNGIYVKSLDSDEVRLVVNANSNVAYVSPGYLLYARDGVLVAQPFDAERATTTGEPVSIAEPVDQFPESSLAAFSASGAGVLAYRGSAEALSRLLWFDRSGNRVGEIGEPRPYRNPRLSPDGTRVAVELVDRSGNRDIWLMDVARGVPVRFTFGRDRDSAPVWSPDGQKIAWQGHAEMYMKASTGAGNEERLRNEPWIPDEWLRDGSALLCHPTSPRQIWALPVLGADRTPRPVVEGRAITSHARVSPDGRWVAFMSTDSGRLEIYVQKFPKPDGWSLVSTNGGIQPKWSRDGKELFYVALNGTLMAVPLTLGTLAEVGKAQPLFPTRIEPTTGVVWHQYDLSLNGQRFLVNTPEAVTSPVTMVLNWPALLKQ